MQARGAIRVEHVSGQVQHAVAGAGAGGAQGVPLLQGAS